ncbi:MAG: ATP-binding protein [Anaerolineales bacterium]
MHPTSRPRDRFSSQALGLGEMHHEALFAVAASNGTVLDANSLAGRRLGARREELIGRPLAELLGVPEIGPMLSSLAPGRPVRWTQRLNLPPEDPPHLWEIQAIRLPGAQEPDALVSLRQQPEAESSSYPRLREGIQFLRSFSQKIRQESLLQELLAWGTQLLEADFSAVLVSDGEGGPAALAAEAGLPPGLPADPGLALKDLSSAPYLWHLGDAVETPLAAWALSAGTRQIVVQDLDHSAPLRALLLLGWKERNPLSDSADLNALLSIALLAELRGRTLDQGLQQAQGQLSQFRAIAESLMEATPQAVLLVAQRGGSVVRANPGAEAMFGYRSSELAEMKTEDWLTSPEAVMALRAASESDRIREASELTLYRRNGEEFPAFLRAVPIAPMDPGEPRQVLVVISDLAASQAVQSEVQHLQRQAVLGWLAASFAHEVRNPLNNLSLQLGEMSVLHELEPGLRELVVEAQEECRRLSEISRRMLDFARGQDFHLVPTAMPDLVNRVLQRVQPSLDRSAIQTHLTVAEGVLPALADPLSIEQVILNLVDNAAKAMPQGGHLAISLQGTRLASGRPAVEVRVADTGQGLPAQVQDHLFQPYVTTRAEGHGLGLALSRHILDAHHGSLMAESYAGSGTVFRVVIPAATEEN